MSCKTLITIRLFLYLCCFHKVESATPSFTVPLSSTPHGSVDENSPRDIPILTVKGTDTDGDTLRYSLVTQIPSSPPFSLDSITGLLKTPTGLDAEFSLTYNFTFGVSDGSTTVNSVVYTLNINDINEFTPEFQGTTINVSLLDSVSNGTDTVVILITIIISVVVSAVCTTILNILITRYCKRRNRSAMASDEKTITTRKKGVSEEINKTAVRVPMELLNQPSNTLGNTDHLYEHPDINTIAIRAHENKTKPLL